jgi:hypothetical protein
MPDTVRPGSSPDYLIRDRDGAYPASLILFILVATTLPDGPLHLQHRDNAVPTVPGVHLENVGTKEMRDDPG